MYQERCRQEDERCLPEDPPFWGGEWSAHPTRHLFVDDVGSMDSRQILADLQRTYMSIEDVRNYRVEGKRYGCYIDFKYVGDAYASMHRDRELRRIFGLSAHIVYVKGMASRNIWAGNLPLDAKRDDLENIFGKYGPVQDIMMRHESKCAFIKYGNVQDAMKACSGVQLQRFLGDYLAIDYGRTEDENLNELLGLPPRRIRAPLPPKRAKDRGEPSTHSTQDTPKRDMPEKSQRNQDTSTKKTKYEGGEGSYTPSSTHVLSPPPALFGLGGPGMPLMSAPGSPLSPGRSHGTPIHRADLMRSNVTVCEVSVYPVNAPLGSYAGVSWPPAINVTSRLELSTLPSYVMVDQSFMVYMIPSPSQPPGALESFNEFCNYLGLRSRVSIMVLMMMMMIVSLCPLTA
eukprot:TRINITY_DN8274_c0_g1_i4.p1 TRINITY_DN8274_c0_g1~~TRINITY_DN8274_c0_g1_i4.p1  ORF type:complete len:401 (-),score=76.49 TRINITY_DN8274_c0_g1_i4:12-1214(-)